MILSGSKRLEMEPEKEKSLAIDASGQDVTWGMFEIESSGYILNGTSECS